MSTRASILLPGLLIALSFLGECSGKDRSVDPQQQEDGQTPSSIAGRSIGKPELAPAVEKSPERGDGPEATLIEFLVAVMACDKARVTRVIVPTNDASILWQGQPAAAQAMAEMKKAVAAVRRLQPGETVNLPGGRKLLLDKSHVNANRQQLTLPGNPIPFTLIRQDGQWKVDPRPMIAGRKAAAKARR
jgi:hypothetical protein